MNQAVRTRYDNVAISLHWLMAILIVGMLVVGKIMASMDDEDSLRFVLVQWHKSIGISLLFLIVIRLLWRVGHRAPAHPENAPVWEMRAAGVSHVLLYGLLLLVPVTGWMLVSVSPLNLPTLLFETISWPHLPWLAELENKGEVVGRFHNIHEFASTLLGALVLLHAAAALKHHWIDKDDVLVRMLPRRGTGIGKTLFRLVATGVALAAAVAAMNIGKPAVSLSAGQSQVQFVADITGEKTSGIFTVTSVEANIVAGGAGESFINATVDTAVVESDNLQMSGALPLTEWFDTGAYPQAQFRSSSILVGSDGKYDVSGELTIKEITLPQSFRMSIGDSDGKRMASGEFSVDRLAYKLGMQSQPDTSYVGQNVLVRFQFELNDSGN